MWMKDFIRKIRIGWMHAHAPFCWELKLSSSKILIVAPHPDDECMGTGGLVRRLVCLGYAPHVLFMTQGEGSHGACCDLDASSIKEARKKLAMHVAKVLELPDDHLHWMDFPDGGIGQSVSKDNLLEGLMGELSPQIVFVPHWGEGWPDHVNAAKIVKSLVHKNATVYEYCVWLWYYNVWHLDWKNACVLRMTREEHEMKCRCVDMYVTPLAPCGKPWSGVLPAMLVDAAKWKNEFFFKCK